jgi:hypothetical protein
MVLRRFVLLVSLSVLHSYKVVALCMIATGSEVVKTSLARLLSSIVDFAPHHEVYLRADGAVAKRVDALERKPSKLRITVALDAYHGLSRRAMERGCPSRTAKSCLWTRYQLEKTAVLRDALLAGSRGALYVDSDVELFAPPPPFPGGRVALSHARMHERTRKAFGTYNGGSILVRDPAVLDAWKAAASAADSSCCQDQVALDAVAAAFDDVSLLPLGWNLGWYSVYADLSEDARDHLADVSCAGGALVYGRAPLYSAHFRHGSRARDRRSFTRRVRRSAANCTVLKRPP